MDAQAIKAGKLMLTKDGLRFCRYFFKQMFGSNMVISSHHVALQRALDRTMLPPSDPDFISRLIITLPPGYGKTIIAVNNYIARGLAINPAARFLHLSYSNNLALQNSAMVREIVKSQLYQQLWNVQTKDDTDSKSLWWTMEMGGVYATAAGGQVTGFRAGHMDNAQFTGSLLVDDPLKPDDANYEQKREAVNNRFGETIASRLAVETVPIIIIMQRLHYNDLVGFLLRGGSGEKWYHLDLPVIVDNTVRYPEEYTHGIQLEHNVPDGWLWPMKHNDSHEMALRAHRRKFAAQYMQRPMRVDDEDTLWSEEIINNARNVWHENEPSRVVVGVDPAVSSTSTSDEHGIVVVARHGDKEYSVIRDLSCRGTPMDWARRTIEAVEQHGADAVVVEVNQGGDMCENTLRNAGYKGRVLKVRASKGKVLRAEPVVALYEQGMVRHEKGLQKLEAEMADMSMRTGLAGGKSPNRVDALVWALTQVSQGVEMGRLLKLVVGGR